MSATGLGTVLSGGSVDPPYFDAVYPPPGFSVGTLTQNVVYLTLTRVAVPKTITKMRLFVSTAAGNLDMGYFTDDDNDGTYVRETHTGDTVAVGAAANQDVNLLSPITLQPNRNYWRAIINSSSTLQTERITVYGGVTGLRPNWCQAAGVTYATAPGLPTTLSGLTISHTVLVDIAGLP